MFLIQYPNDMEKKKILFSPVMFITKLNIFPSSCFSISTGLVCSILFPFIKYSYANTISYSKLKPNLQYEVCYAVIQHKEKNHNLPATRCCPVKCSPSIYVPEIDTYTCNYCGFKGPVIAQSSGQM